MTKGADTYHMTQEHTQREPTHTPSSNSWSGDSYEVVSATLSGVRNRHALKALLERTDLQEGQFLDLKRKTWGRTDEIAKDACAMAFHGGFIIVGVDENDLSADFAVRLEGEPERIEQAIVDIVSPALHFVLRTVALDDERGFIILQIPPSPSGIHRANNKVPYRKGRVTTYLNDAQAKLLSDSRTLGQSEVEKLLEAGFTGKTQNGLTELIVAGSPILSAGRSFVHQLQDDPNIYTNNGFFDTVLRASCNEVLERFDHPDLGMMPFYPLVDQSESGPEVKRAPWRDGLSLRIGESGKDIDQQLGEIASNGTFRLAISGPSLAESQRFDESIFLLACHVALCLARNLHSASGQHNPWAIGMTVKQLGRRKPLVRTTQSGQPSEGFSASGTFEPRELLSSTELSSISHERFANMMLGDFLHRLGRKQFWNARGLINAS